MHALFHTDTILLRSFEPGDLAGLHIYLNHPELVGRRYLPWGFSNEAPLSSGQVQGVLDAWMKKDEKHLHLAVVSQESALLIGHAEVGGGWDALSGEANVVIDPTYQRRGYGGQVLDLLLRYIFENTPAHTVQVWYSDWNAQAERLAASRGFQPAGGIRWVGMRQGKPYDEKVMDLLRPEWRARQEG